MRCDTPFSSILQLGPCSTDTTRKRCPKAVSQYSNGPNRSRWASMRDPSTSTRNLLKTEATNLDGIRMIPVSQFDGMAHFPANLGPSPQGRSIELCLLHLKLTVVSFDRRLYQRHVNVLA